MGGLPLTKEPGKLVCTPVLCTWIPHGTHALLLYSGTMQTATMTPCLLPSGVPASQVDPYAAAYQFHLSFCSIVTLSNFCFIFFLHP